MDYGLDDEDIVFLSQQVDYKYILNDIVYLLRINNDEIHIMST